MNATFDLNENNDSVEDIIKGTIETQEAFETQDTFEVDQNGSYTEILSQKSDVGNVTLPRELDENKENENVNATIIISKNEEINMNETLIINKEGKESENNFNETIVINKEASPAINENLRRGTFTMDPTKVAKVSPMVPERVKGKIFFNSAVFFQFFSVFKY